MNSNLEGAELVGGLPMNLENNLQLSFGQKTPGLTPQCLLQLWPKVVSETKSFLLS